MPTYKIMLRRVTTEQAVVEIEADGLSNAAREARILACNNGIPTWSYVDSVITEAHISAVTGDSQCVNPKNK